MENTNTKLKELRKNEKRASNYIGAINEKIDIEVCFTRSVIFDNDFSGGYSYIHFFKDEEGNVLVWKTAKTLDLEKNDKVKIKATIKNHSVYDGEKQTYITRAKIE